MTKDRWDVVVSGLGSLEAPCFGADGALHFSDMSGEGSIFRFSEVDGLHKIIERREIVGGLVPHIDGGLVASGPTLAVINGDQIREIVRPIGGWGFNDLRTDSRGNVFVGMHGENPTARRSNVGASLWRVGADKSILKLYGDVQMTNGIGLSPDETSLYHCDTLRRVIWASDLSEEGSTFNRRVLCEVSEGMPDGMAMDEAGCMWVASVGAGKVIRITPEGVEDTVLATPTPFPSSICFGGPDRREMYVTTLGPPFHPEHTGTVLRIASDVVGATVFPASI